MINQEKIKEKLLRTISIKDIEFSEKLIWFLEEGGGKFLFANPYENLKNAKLLQVELQSFIEDFKELQSFKEILPELAELNKQLITNNIDYIQF
jgi:hypothetical protein